MELVLKTPELYFDNDRICYQHIYSHYWHASYGNFNVVMHKPTGYVNVTRLCKVHGKQFKNWNANKSVKALIDGLAEKLTVPSDQLILSIVGGSGESKKVICGTYAHPILLPHIASWLDHTFAGIVSGMANGFFHLQTQTVDLGVLRHDEKLHK